MTKTTTAFRYEGSEILEMGTATLEMKLRFVSFSIFQWKRRPSHQLAEEAHPTDPQAWRDSTVMLCVLPLRIQLHS